MGGCPCDTCKIRDYLKRPITTVCFECGYLLCTVCADDVLQRNSNGKVKGAKPCPGCGSKTGFISDKKKNHKKLERLINEQVEGMSYLCSPRTVFRTIRCLLSHPFHLFTADERRENWLLHLGMVYEDNAFGFEKIKGLYLQAAEMGSSEAYSRLAELHRERKGDYSNAKQYWEKAAELGHVVALRNLAVAAEKGYFDFGHGPEGREVCTKDPEKAFEYLERAARHGDREACRGLAGYFALGIGCTESRSEFVKWIRRSAAKGDVTAMGMMGRKFMEGDEVEQDMQQAEYWLRKASEAGDEEAANLLAHLLG